MKYTKKILEYITQNKSTEKWFIPQCWLPTGMHAEKGMRSCEVQVEKSNFYIHFLQEIITLDDQKQYSLEDNKIENASIYSLLVRSYTAWDHEEKDVINPGTFLKTICRLKSLKDMGIDILYLLPPFYSSVLHKKGALGSPYAIKDFYNLDPMMHDSAVGGYNKDKLNNEFSAFVECAHALGMKVMVDFAFRTVARDSVLLYNHPEWFYWIKKEYEAGFTPPPVTHLPQSSPINEKNIKALYASDAMPAYLSWFTINPKDVDEKKWDMLKNRAFDTGENLLTLVEEEMGLTTAPGFPDVLNDPQPPWTDVTYLRYFNDEHTNVSGIPEDQPPYILQDTAKLSVNPGKDKNDELWKLVEEIIPYYVKQFSIDGARVDMGHALPIELNQRIVECAKASNPRFLLWSEELKMDKAAESQQAGYHFISGEVWGIYKQFDSKKLNKLLINQKLMDCALPIAASLETPDTPRAALVHGRNIDKLIQLMWLNAFLPNAVPFINAGQELVAIQPMNLGLDNTEEGRFVLEEDDPMYGKLAFFDYYRLHWNEYNKQIVDTFREIARVRNRYSAYIAKSQNYTAPGIKCSNLWTIVPYINENQGIILIINRSDKKMKIKRSKLLKSTQISRINILYNSRNTIVQEKDIILSAHGTLVANIEI
ncbi:MAG: alpha amylase [Clostridiales bacterium]|nr:alpha amylase [Clostridiales bacterium]